MENWSRSNLFTLLLLIFMVISTLAQVASLPKESRRRLALMYLFALLLISAVSISTWFLFGTGSLEGISRLRITPFPPQIYKNDLPLHVAIAIDNEINKLSQGQITFNPSGEMKAGVNETVEVRISRSFLADLSAGLKSNGEIQKESIKVSPYMGVNLNGTEGFFNIKLMNGDERKLVTESQYSQWIYDITPIKRGAPSLYLTVYIILNTPEGERKYERTIFQRSITVSPSPGDAFKNFINVNWDKVIGILISSGIIGWIIGKRRGKKTGEHPWETIN